MMNVPDIYRADDLGIKNHPMETCGDKWVLARPVRFQGLMVWHRLCLALRVFLGRADVLTWAADETKKRGDAEEE